MYRQFFGLKHDPLGKDCTQLWDSGQIVKFEKQFKWLLQSPGIGLLTADPGLGKTAMLHQVTRALLRLGLIYVNRLNIIYMRQAA